MATYTVEQYDAIIKTHLEALKSPDAIVEYTHNGNAVKKSRDQVKKDLAFWRTEKNREYPISRKIQTRFA